MKTKIILMKTVIIVIVALGVHEARGQYWRLGGNTLTQDTALGSKNNYNIKIITNNLERARVTTAGHLGIGAVPSVRLHVQNTAASEIARFNGGSNMFLSMYEGGAARGYLGSYAGSAADIDLGTFTGNQAGKVHLTIRQKPQVTVDVNGKVGIGTTTPAARLNIIHNSFVNDPQLLLHETENDFARLNFSNTASTNYFSVAGLPAATMRDAKLNFYYSVAGVENIMTLQGDGNVGIGTVNPFRKLEVNGHQRLTSTTANSYLEFFKPGTTADQQDWRFDHDGSRLYVSSSSDNFENYCDIAYFGNCTDTYKFTVMGSALASGGIWQNSDLKLKKDISDFNSGLEIIKQLKPKSYYFKTTEFAKLNLPGKKQYGFIAQELEQVLPELVQSSTETVATTPAGERKTDEIKAVNYTELIPILTKAIQEQQEQIDELKLMIRKLAPKGEVANTELSVNSKGLLGQNVPNPFTKNTNIPYNIPAGSKRAILVITNSGGQAVKQEIISSAGPGSVNVDAGSLAAGTYNYSLFIDGKLAASKKMIVAK